jgi:LAO/AO transport system ATPase
MLSTLIDRFRRGDRLALARLVSLVARGEQVEEILAAIGPRGTYASEGPSLTLPARTPDARQARVVSLTGSGGVGKSTLTGKLIEVIRQVGLRVAVLACDPQSPLSGGALLGDRFRMPSGADEGVFIRSLAAAGGQGALAAHIDAIIRLVEAFGFDVVLVETVGAGQGDTVVRELVDVLVVLLQPETGDDLQWEKAGLLEVADVIVIHKADLPGADRVEAQVLAALALSPRSADATPLVPVLRVSSRTGAGVSELWQTIAARPLRRGARRDAAELLRLTQQRLALRFASHRHDEALAELVRRWQAGTIDTEEAVAALVRLLG